VKGEEMQVLPGQEIGKVSEVSAGRGCFIDGEVIRSSLLGHVIQDNTGCVNVISSFNKLIQEPSIEVGDVVLCRVIKITINQVTTEIISTKDIILTSKYNGSIRKEDVRLHEEDVFEMSSFFQLGDIVRAIVISLGDSRQYFLRTAEAEYGVRFALSKHGSLMTPTSWKVVYHLYIYPIIH
jgi:exosome complex component CSL4